MSLPISMLVGCACNRWPRDQIRSFVVLEYLNGNGLSKPNQKQLQALFLLVSGIIAA
jgi:hypothetical protein